MTKVLFEKIQNHEPEYFVLPFVESKALWGFCSDSIEKVYRGKVVGR